MILQRRLDIQSSDDREEYGAVCVYRHLFLSLSGVCRPYALECYFCEHFHCIICEDVHNMTVSKKLIIIQTKVLVRF